MGERICVVQAYEAPRTPRWISACMESVRSWCRLKGFEYHVSPEFFGLVPPAFMARCGPDRGPATDYARAVLLDRWLARCDIAIWVDADILVFDAEALNLPRCDGLFGIDELTVLYDRGRNRAVLKNGLNGAILGAASGDARLGQYRQAMEVMAKEVTPNLLGRTVAGPELLTRLSQTIPIGRIGNVGLLTYYLIEEIAEQRPQLCALLMRELGRPLAAANLCHFHARTLDGRSLATFESTTETAIQQLIETRGEVLNCLVPPDCQNT